MNRPASLTAVSELALDYARIRAHSLELIRGLSPEDCQLQSMTDASPLRLRSLPRLFDPVLQLDVVRHVIVDRNAKLRGTTRRKGVDLGRGALEYACERDIVEGDGSSLRTGSL